VHALAAMLGAAGRLALQPRFRRRPVVGRHQVQQTGLEQGPGRIAVLAAEGGVHGEKSQRFPIEHREGHRIAVEQEPERGALPLDVGDVHRHADRPPARQAAVLDANEAPIGELLFFGNPVDQGGAAGDPLVQPLLLPADGVDILLVLDPVTQQFGEAHALAQHIEASAMGRSVLAVPEHAFLAVVEDRDAFAHGVQSLLQEAVGGLRLALGAGELRRSRRQLLSVPQGLVGDRLQNGRDGGDPGIAPVPGDDDALQKVGGLALQGRAREIRYDRRVVDDQGGAVHDIRDGTAAVERAPVGAGHLQGKLVPLHKADRDIVGVHHPDRHQVRRRREPVEHHRARHIAQDRFNPDSNIT
jgi:hypothetical protein